MVIVAGYEPTQWWEVSDGTKVESFAGGGSCESGGRAPVELETSHMAAYSAVHQADRKLNF